MSRVDVSRARSVLRRRPGGERAASDPFVKAALETARNAEVGDLDEIVERLAAVSAEAAGLAAVAEQHRDGLGLSETMGLLRVVEATISRAALSFEGAADLSAALGEDRETISQPGVLR
jgi:hypothetical protein